MTINPLIPIGLAAVFMVGGIFTYQGCKLSDAKAELGSKQTEVMQCRAGIEAQNEAIAALNAKNEAEDRARNKRVSAHRRSQGTVGDIVELGQLNEQWGGI